MLVSRRQARPERVWWGDSSLDLTSWTKVRPAGRASNSTNRMVSACRWEAADLRSEARGIAYSPCRSRASSPSTSTFPVSTAVSIQSSVARTAGDVLVHDRAFVVTELAVAQARNDPAGRRDERVAGGDQVQELHRPVDRADHGATGLV